MRILLSISIALLLSVAAYGQAAQIYPWVYGTCGQDFALSSGHTGTYTIGEILVSSLKGPGIWVTEGFHQADPVDGVSIHEELEDDQDIKVFPNPTKGQVTFELNQNQAREVKVYLVDMLGRVLDDQTLKATWGQLVFDLSQLADSYYFLRAVTDEGNSIGTYKVQKVN